MEGYFAVFSRIVSKTVFHWLVSGHLTFGNVYIYTDNIAIVNLICMYSHN